MAVHSCPTKELYCGSTKEIEFSDTSAAEQTITMSGSWSAGDQCTWLVKATCGAPGLKIQSIDATNPTDDEVDIFYMEYNTDEVVLDYDSTLANWPSYYSDRAETTFQNTATPDYTDSSGEAINVQGEMPYFKQVTQVSPERYMSVPAIVVAEWMQAKRDEFTSYEQTVAEYDVLRQEYDDYVTEQNNYYTD